MVSKQVYLKNLPKVSELLVGDGLDGRGVDGPCAVLGGQRKGILSHDCLASTGVGSHKDRVALFQMQHSLLLEGIQLKGEVVCQVGSQPMQQRPSGLIWSQPMQQRLSGSVPDAARPLFGRGLAQRGSCVPSLVSTYATKTEWPHLVSTYAAKTEWLCSRCSTGSFWKGSSSKGKLGARFGLNLGNKD